jgi:hypothetical protein
MKTISTIIVLGFATFFCYTAFVEWLELPEVYVNTNGDCVKVVTYNGSNLDCDTLPAKYIYVRVQ